MSDYISNYANFSIFNNCVRGKNNNSSYEICPDELNSRLSRFDRDGVRDSQGNVYNQNKSVQRQYQQRGLFRLSSPENESSNISDDLDVSYLGELEQFSTKLIHLLRSARQGTFKVNTSDGIFQPSQKIKHQAKSKHSRCYLEERQRLSDLSTFKGTQPHEYIDDVQEEHHIRMPARIRSTSTGIVNNNTCSDVFHQIEKAVDIDESSGSGHSSPGLASKRQNTHNANDRQKKDAHNKVEMRRRSAINDRITELRNLLPEYIDRETCQKKGSILNEAVEYIKKLKSELCRLKLVEGKLRETGIIVRKLDFKVKRLEENILPQLNDRGLPEQVQNKITTQEPSVIRSARLLPVTRTNRQHSLSTLSESRSKAMSQTFPSEGMEDDVSTTPPSQFIPYSYEMDIDDLDCYL